MRFYWHSTLLLSELKDICWSVFFQYFGTAVNTLDELAFHFLILPVLWKETLRNACFGLSILCAWVLHCSPVDKWTGTVIKRPPLHPTLPPFSAVVLSFCSSDETGLSKWPERNNTYFIREVGTARMHQSGREGRPRPGVGDLVMGQCGGRWSAWDGDWEFGRWQNLNIVSFRILLVDVHDDNDGVDGWSNEKRR